MFDIHNNSSYQNSLIVISKQSIVKAEARLTTKELLSQRVVTM